MDFNVVSEMASSEATFALLFIASLIFVGRWFLRFIEEQKQENHEREQQLIESFKEQLDKSDKRETRLMVHLEKNTEQLESIADTLSGVERRLTSFETKVGNELEDVWKELKAKADKED
ncbi:hypothetical protein CHCC5027_3552 [Bacillus paralicheniformis]|uniref:hypothetical protein n=1 Tax=Bacillus paralicheniformis TaxID=1648923 RepID=UPI0011A64B45|nr:hypothetical protein [Bacillus paralicheniformis]TWJ39639.1 hypothetical protein CHCC5027_3552 [Bacillus paralicheniformis]